MGGISAHSRERGDPAGSTGFAGTSENRNAWTTARLAAHCTVVKKRDSRSPAGHVQIGWCRTREIPRSDQGFDASDQIGDRQQPDAAGFDGDAAVGGVVAIVAHDKKMVGRHDDFGHIIEGADAR